VMLMATGSREFRTLPVTDYPLLRENVLKLGRTLDLQPEQFAKRRPIEETESHRDFAKDLLGGSLFAENLKYFADLEFALDQCKGANLRTVLAAELYRRLNLPWSGKLS
jgi:hypothetical protein